MTAKTAAPVLTLADLEAGYQHDDWLGFGYLGDRRNLRAAGIDSTVADVAALEVANAKGWTREDLFTWSNSKLGRWYCDVTLGSSATADEARRWAAEYVK